MKKIVLLLLLIVVVKLSSAQKVDSIFFNLYTDSLKKGQHNYINIDGKLSNGRWLPLTAKDITFSCLTASFAGNELIIPFDFKDEKVIVRAILKSNPSIAIEKIIWIKKSPDPILPTREEIMNTPQGSGNKKTKKKGK